MTDINQEELKIEVVLQRIEWLKQCMLWYNVRYINTSSPVGRRESESKEAKEESESES